MSQLLFTDKSVKIWQSEDGSLNMIYPDILIEDIEGWEMKDIERSANQQLFAQAEKIEADTNSFDESGVTDPTPKKGAKYILWYLRSNQGKFDKSKAIPLYYIDGDPYNTNTKAKPIRFAKFPEIFYNSGRRTITMTYWANLDKSGDLTEPFIPGKNSSYDVSGRINDEAKRILCSTEGQFVYLAGYPKSADLTQPIMFLVFREPVNIFTSSEQKTGQVALDVIPEIRVDHTIDDNLIGKGNDANVSYRATNEDGTQIGDADDLLKLTSRTMTADSQANYVLGWYKLPTSPGFYWAHETYSVAKASEYASKGMDHIITSDYRSIYTLQPVPNANTGGMTFIGLVALYGYRYQGTTPGYVQIAGGHRLSLYMSEIETDKDYNNFPRGGVICNDINRTGLLRDVLIIDQDSTGQHVEVDTMAQFCGRTLIEGEKNVYTGIRGKEIPIVRKGLRRIGSGPTSGSNVDDNKVREGTGSGPLWFTNFKAPYSLDPVAQDSRILTGGLYFDPNESWPRQGVDAKSGRGVWKVFVVDPYESGGGDEPPDPPPPGGGGDKPKDPPAPVDPPKKCEGSPSPGQEGGTETGVIGLVAGDGSILNISPPPPAAGETLGTRDSSGTDRINRESAALLEAIAKALSLPIKTDKPLTDSQKLLQDLINERILQFIDKLLFAISAGEVITLHNMRDLWALLGIDNAVLDNLGPAALQFWEDWFMVNVFPFLLKVARDNPLLSPEAILNKFKQLFFDTLGVRPLAVPSQKYFQLITPYFLGKGKASQNQQITPKSNQNTQQRVTQLENKVGFVTPLVTDSAPTAMMKFSGASGQLSSVGETVQLAAAQDGFYLKWSVPFMSASMLVNFTVDAQLKNDVDLIAEIVDPTYANLAGIQNKDIPYSGESQFIPVLSSSPIGVTVFPISPCAPFGSSRSSNFATGGQVMLMGYGWEELLFSQECDTVGLRLRLSRNLAFNESFSICTRKADSYDADGKLSFPKAKFRPSITEYHRNLGYEDRWLHQRNSNGTWTVTGVADDMITRIYKTDVNKSVLADITDGDAYGQWFHRCASFCMIDSKEPDTNFSLYQKDNYIFTTEVPERHIRNILLKFDLRYFQNFITTAILYFYTYGGDNNAGIEIYEVSDDWKEDKVTWNYMLDKWITASPITTVTPSNQEGFSQVDVYDYINWRRGEGRSYIAFRLVPTKDCKIKLWDRTNFERDTTGKKLLQPIILVS